MNFAEEPLLFEKLRELKSEDIGRLLGEQEAVTIISGQKRYVLVEPTQAEVSLTRNDVLSPVFIKFSDLVAQGKDALNVLFETHDVVVSKDGPNSFAIFTEEKINAIYSRAVEEYQKMIESEIKEKGFYH